MLAELYLENFRRFGTHTIGFGTSTILVGPNNAGKSTVVEALRLVALVTRYGPNLPFREVPDWVERPAGTYCVRSNQSLELVCASRRRRPGHAAFGPPCPYGTSSLRHRGEPMAVAGEKPMAVDKQPHDHDRARQTARHADHSTPPDEPPRGRHDRRRSQRRRAATAHGHQKTAAAEPPPRDAQGGEESRRQPNL